MKRISVLIFTFICILFCSCSESGGESVVGKWIDTTTEQTIEYTSNGYYYEYINESFTSDKTRYRISENEITYYIEGEPESEFSVEYELDGDTLTIGGALEYRRLEASDKDE